MSYRESRDLDKFWRESASDAFVLAEISRTEGSTYRKAGSKKIIAASGEACGLLSGGCLENAIVRTALEFLVALNSTTSEVCFDTSHETDRLLGYQKGCQGKIWVRFMRLAQHTSEASSEMFSELAGSRRLVIFGCGPDAAPLSELLGVMALPHVMIDHRKDLLNEENFRAAEKVIYAAPTASAEHVRDGDAVILMSHNYEADLNILHCLSGKNLCYFGALGPASRFQQLCADLKAFFSCEWPASLTAVTRAPVGLKMQCQDPYDIALSIVAEIIERGVFAVDRAPITAAHQPTSFSTQNLDFTCSTP